MPKKRQHTPEMSASKRLIGRSPGMSQSPHSQQSPSSKYDSFLHILLGSINLITLEF